MAKVKVRVWQTRVGKYMSGWPMTDMTEAVRIWGKLGVEVVPHPEVRMLGLSEVPLGTGANTAEAQIVAELRDPINTAIRGQGADRHIDVVLVPIFKGWGKAFTPLTPLGPRTPGAFAPFEGPVAIVTNGATILEDKTWASRDIQAWPLGADRPPPGGNPNPLTTAASGNDVAHEMGHLFGLWHTVEANRPGRPALNRSVPGQIQYLIHDTVYNQVAKLWNTQQERPRTEDEVRATLAARAPGTQNVTVGRDPEWFVGLRGEEVDPTDLDLVLRNIESGRYLTGQ